MGLANARKELQKNLRSFQTHWCLKTILVSGRFCLTCTRDKNPDSSERRDCGQGSWQAGPDSPGRGWRGPGGFQPSRPLRVAGDPLHGLQFDRSSLGPLAGRPACGRGCCLRKPPRRRGAPGNAMLCQGLCFTGADDE